MKNTKNRNIMKNTKNRYIISEIVELSVIMFVVAMFVALVMSNIFIRFDTYLHDQHYSEGVYNFIKFIELLVQLVLTTIVYFYMEEMIRFIPNLTKMRKSVPFQTSKYVLHIVMIVILIELNISIKHNLEYISKLMIIN